MPWLWVATAGLGWGAWAFGAGGRGGRCFHFTAHTLKFETSVLLLSSAAVAVSLHGWDCTGLYRYNKYVVAGTMQTQSRLITYNAIGSVSLASRVEIQ